MTTARTWAHIGALTDVFGTFEHAKFTELRREHGYCVDDVARLLVVAAREPQPTLVVHGLARGALDFVLAAQDATGACRNRRSADGRWHGPHGVEDCWGRSLWGLGTAAASGADGLAADARAGFRLGARQRSPWPRAMAFAALGAAAVLAIEPTDGPARALLVAAVDTPRVLDADLAPPGARSASKTEKGAWLWPENRLTYANAVLPDALLAAGHALDRPALVADGLALLAWLLDRETVDGQLSVTPVGGAGPGDTAPGFDQQAIEVATMADACARAASLTGERRWRDAVVMADAWFDGANDSGVVMWDPATGGGYDGLEPRGSNRNQGAESTLALISTRQQARLLAAAAAA